MSGCGQRVHHIRHINRRVKTHLIKLLVNVISMFIMAHCVCCQSVSDQVRSLDMILTTWWLIPPPSLSQRTVNGTGCTVLEDFWQANLRIKVKGTILEKELPVMFIAMQTKNAAISDQSAKLTNRMSDCALLFAAFRQSRKIEDSLIQRECVW